MAIMKWLATARLAVELANIDIVHVAIATMIYSVHILYMYIHCVREPTTLPLAFMPIIASH